VPRRSLPNGLWLGAGIVLALASLLYGYSLGERSTDRIEAPTTVTPSITEPRSSPFTQATATFVTTRAGHTGPEGVIEYLNGNWIDDIAVDADGFIWSTGPAGVVQWNPVDGSFTRHTTPDGGGPLGGELIATGARGDVWVSGRSRLSHWDGHEWRRDAHLFTNHDVAQTEVDADYSRVATMPDGSLWVASRREESGGEAFMLHRTEATFQGRVESWELPGQLAALERAPDGALWMGTEDRAWRLENGRWTLAIDAEGSWLSDPAFAADGSVWLLDETRVIVWDNGRSTTVTELDGSLVEDGWPRWVILDQDDAPWVVILSEDASGGDGELVRLADLSRHPIPAWNPTKPVVGADGNIWMGTSDGLVGFDGTTWSTLRIADDPPLMQTTGLAIDDDGAVWIATRNEIITWDGSTWTTHTATDLGFSPAAETESSREWWWEPEPWVVTRPGAPLWAGFGCHAAYRDGDSWFPIGGPLAIDASFCRTSDRDIGPDGSLWIIAEDLAGTTLRRYQDGGWSMVSAADGVDILAISPDGSVWGAGGIMRLVDGEWSKVLDGLWFSSIAAADDGSVWAASGWGWWHEGYAGIWKFDEGVSSHVAAFNALDLEIDSAGIVWAIGRDLNDQSGLWQIDPWEHRAVATGEFSAIAPAPDGSLWLAGPGRLLRLPPHSAIESTGS
jgi:ligand-binding sensor domain-containing protein